MACNDILENTLNLSGIFSNIFPASITLNVYLLVKLMILSRIINPDSKFSLTRWYHRLSLPEKLPKQIDVHQFYASLDHLLTYKETIELALFAQLKTTGLIETTVVFYDLTSSYVEGEDCEIAKKGYSRDHRFDCLQITLGLVIDRKNGLPLYHEVFEGNMRVSKTVKWILEKLQTLFPVKKFCFRGG